MSSGANIYVAIQVARKITTGNIVVMAPDGGDKYLSTGVFD
jgi:cysteine synthase A